MEEKKRERTQERDRKGSERKRREKEKGSKKDKGRNLTGGTQALCSKLVQKHMNVVDYMTTQHMTCKNISWICSHLLVCPISDFFYFIFLRYHVDV